MKKNNKSQISLFIASGLIILILVSIILLYQKEKQLKEYELEKTKKELFNLKKISFMSFSKDCLEESFYYAIDEYGFDEEKIKEKLKIDFPDCLEKNNIIDKEVDKNNISIIVIDSDEKIFINFTLKTKLKDEDFYDEISNYYYEFSKITFRNLKIEDNVLVFDTKIISTDEKAYLTLKKGTSFFLNNEPVSQIAIKVDKKPDFSFIIGNFIYEIFPDNMKSNEIMFFTIKYKDEWLQQDDKKIDPKKLKIAYFNEEKKEWRFLPTIINKEKKEATILTKHFSKYALVYLESDTPIVERKNDEAYIAGFYNGGINTEEQAALISKSSEETNEELCNNVDYDNEGDLNFKNIIINILPFSYSGCIDSNSNYIFKIKNFDKNIYNIAVFTNEGVEKIIQKQGNDVLIYLSANKKIDFNLKIKEIDNVNLPILDYPVYDNVGISYCFADRGYSKKASEEKYIHAGTDILESGYVTAACDAEIIDIWNKDISLVCNGNRKNYYKTQPFEEPGVNYGNALVLKCINSDVYLIYMHLENNNFLIRNPNNINEYREYCIGEQVKIGEILGEAGNTGSSHGEHLHFEVRKGKPNENGVPPRINAINPALLYKFNKNSLTEKFYIKLLEGGTTYEKKIDEDGCINTFAMIRGASLSEIFPEIYE